MTLAAASLVIFDHDGVLVDSEIIAMELLAEMTTRAGLPMSVEEAFDQYLGTSFGFVMDHLRGHGIDVNPDELQERFHEDLFQGFRDRLTPVPGIPELLDQLTSSGRRISIASSGSSARVRLGITSTRIDHNFKGSVITTAEDVQRGKPEPDLFLLTAQRAGVAPEACIVIEDSPFGIEAAHRAGMPAIGLAFRTPAAALAQADIIVESPAEIARILNPPNSRA